MFALWPHCDELPGKSTTSSTTNRQSIAPWSTKAMAGGASKARGTGKDRGAGDSARPSAAADGAAAGRTREEEGRARSTRADLPRSSKTTERKAQLQERQRESRREVDERRGERKSDREADDEAGGERHALPSA
jgi:hypothetical protein